MCPGIFEGVGEKPLWPFWGVPFVISARHGRAHAARERGGGGRQQRLYGSRSAVTAPLAGVDGCANMLRAYRFRHRPPRAQWTQAPHPARAQTAPLRRNPQGSPEESVEGGMASHPYDSLVGCPFASWDMGIVSWCEFVFPTGASRTSTGAGGGPGNPQPPATALLGTLRTVG